MKILITGGAGFIGSHLVEELIKEEHHILVVDNLLTGKKENLIVNDKIQFLQDDIGSESALKTVLEFNPNICFHLAAQSSVVVSVERPDLDFDHNILQPIKLLKVLLETDCSKIVFTSSGGTIFGEPINIPTSETDFAGEPESPYGVAKKYLNEFIIEITKGTGLSYSILNLANVYGPRQDPHGEAGVISIFSKKYLNNQEPFVYGDGNQTRDYIYVKDIVSALVLSSKLKNNTFLNIGTGIETSVNDLVTAIKDEFDSNIEPIYLAAREGELQRSVLNNSKAKEELNWKPEVSLSDGIKQVVNWLKN